MKTDMDNEKYLSPVPGLIIAAILLLLALAHMPYGYYLFLRWFVCIAAIYGVWVASKQGFHVWAWVLLPIGLLFNPLIPIHMRRQEWITFDIISAIVLILGAIKLNSSRSQNDDHYKK